VLEFRSPIRNRLVSKGGGGAIDSMSFPGQRADGAFEKSFDSAHAQKNSGEVRAQCLSGWKGGTENCSKKGYKGCKSIPRNWRSSSTQRSGPMLQGKAGPHLLDISLRRAKKVGTAKNYSTTPDGAARPTPVPAPKGKKKNRPEAPKEVKSKTAARSKPRDFRSARLSREAAPHPEPRTNSGMRAELKPAGSSRSKREPLAGLEGGVRTRNRALDRFLPPSWSSK